MFMDSDEGGSQSTNKFVHHVAKDVDASKETFMLKKPCDDVIFNCPDEMQFPYYLKLLCKSLASSRWQAIYWISLNFVKNNMQIVIKILSKLLLMNWDDNAVASADLMNRIDSIESSPLPYACATSRCFKFFARRTFAHQLYWEEAVNDDLDYVRYQC